MTRARPEWLQNLQLARAAGGVEALEALDRLAPEARRAVVFHGQRLFETSPAIAQAYMLKAPRAAARLEPRAFSAWASLGSSLAARRFGNREAAAAFFRLDPPALMSAGAPVIESWLERARELQDVSRRLAVVFLEASGPGLSRLGPGAESLLRAWSRAGAELATGGGWRGEFLSAAFFTGAGAALGVLDQSEIPAWAALGLRVQTGRDLDQGFFRRLPARFGELALEHRQRLFGLCLRVADRAPRIARDLFFALPPAVADLGRDEQAELLSAIAAAAGEAPEILKLVPMLAGIVRAVPPCERAPLLARAARTARRFPRCLPALLRSFPRAREETDREGIERWIDHGERVAAESLEAGRAFFALESETGLRRLRENSAAVRLEDVQGVLRALARMLAGESLEIRAGIGASLRAFLDLETLERTSVALPAAANPFDSWEENFLVMKLACVNAVGRLWYGTYELSLPEVWRRLPAKLAEIVSGAVPGTRLADLLGALPEADPLIGIFVACEGARIDARLRAVYRGYGAALQRLAARLLEHLPREGEYSTPELLLYLLGAGVAPPRLARLARDVPRELIDLLASTLLSPAAAPEDSLAIAILLRERLVDSIEVAGFGPQTTYDELLFEKSTGDAALDPEPEDGRGFGKPGAREIVDVDPAAVEESDEERPGSPLGAEELRRLLEAGAVLKVGKDAVEESAGIFATGLWLPHRDGEEAERAGTGPEVESGKGRRGAADGVEFEYDEWDYQIRDYRSRWCRLRETVPGSDSGEFFQQALARHADLLPEVRRQFQRIRPERLKRIRGLEDGEDFDLNAVVESRVELRAGRSPSDRLYVARRREERDVATLFLVDMSASTDEPIGAGGGQTETRAKPRRVIDVTKEALVVMAEALHEIGDQYAIYGFSGEGRFNVEFYRVKHFHEGLSPAVRGRIGGIEPRRSTRMGAALRHAIAKMENLAVRSRHILLLSDGFPQDFDYGNDRRSNVYAIHDTMMAFQECQAAGITPFCITVDKTGHDYLRQMCERSRYMVIGDVEALPSELPKIYERWIHA